MKLSVVSPVYKAESMVEELVQRILALSIPEISEMELVLVEDGSPDQSWEEIKKVAAKYPQVKGIQLSRNFGQHPAIIAGLQACSGDWVVVMDCDLQDVPEEIPLLFEKQKATEADIVFAKRERRQDSLFKKATSTFFYKTFFFLSGIKHNAGVANFGLYRRITIQAVLDSVNAHPFFPFLIQSVGFRTAYLPVQHGERLIGKSSYSWIKLIRLSLMVIFTSTQRPLQWVIKLGLFITTASFFMAAFVFLQWLNKGIQVSGYASIMISIWFLTGCTIFTLGVIASYLGKILDNVNRKPIFLIKKTIY
jgi:dolichol-phosphate mannosyltransferase